MDLNGGEPAHQMLDIKRPREREREKTGRGKREREETITSHDLVQKTSKRIEVRARVDLAIHPSCLLG